MDPSPPLPVNREGSFKCTNLQFSVLNTVDKVFDTICCAQYVFGAIYRLPKANNKL